MSKKLFGAIALAFLSLNCLAEANHGLNSLYDSHVRKEADINRCDDHSEGKKGLESDRIYLLKVVFEQDHWIPLSSKSKDEKAKCRWMYKDSDGNYASVAPGSFASNQMFGTVDHKDPDGVNEFVEYDSSNAESAVVPFSCNCDPHKKYKLWIRYSPDGALQSVPIVKSAAHDAIFDYSQATAEAQ